MLTVGGSAEIPGAVVLAATAARIARLTSENDAVVIGPGMREGPSAARLLSGIVARLDRRRVLVLDAGALDLLAADPQALRGRRALITPHAGEMARLRGIAKAQIERDPRGEAVRAATAYRTVVVLKGDETWIAGPDGACYRNRTGNVGLATSGSGDTLSGIVGGLAARGAEPVQAAVWGVFIHGRAGDRLARRVARVGFLARELLAEVPLLLREQEGRRR